MAAKRALLIGSSYDGLPGTDNDVETMANTLRIHGFDVDNSSYVTKLCKDHVHATRQNILDAWEKLIADSVQGDAVVIFYSGHGGLAVSDKARERSESQQPDLPDQFQFLVPDDFDRDIVHWRGILDTEISQLLLRTTEKTENVTYILDCCHSARLGRKPNSTSALAKVWTSDHSKIAKHMVQLREEGRLKEGENWANPNVVRIAAAATEQSAWQHESGGKWVGILTECLAPAIRDPNTTSSWRSIMLGIRALVEEKFDKGERAQQPRSSGIDSRVPFKTERSTSSVFLAEMGTKSTTIRGGRMHGLQKGDAYTLVPLGTTDTATVKVTKVNGFSARASPVPTLLRSGGSSNLALALASTRIHRWPVSAPGSPPFKDWVESSTLFKLTNDKPLVEFQQHGDEVILRAGNLELSRGRLDDESSIDGLFSAAETFARAQDLIRVGDGQDEELFRPKVKITVGLLEDGDKEELVEYDTGSTDPPELELTEGDKIYIRLGNKSENKTSVVYVSVLSIDAAGRTALVTSAWDGGLPLSFEVPHRSLEGRNGEGLPIEWPESVPAQESVNETLLFVMTNEEILDTWFPDHGREARGLKGAASFRPTTPFCVARIPYRLQPKKVPASELPLSDAGEIVLPTQSDTPLSKGAFGAMIRTMKGIPSCVWVINEHSEEITVVVSKYRPNRLLSGGGIGASATGLDLSLSTTTFLGPATKKTLAPALKATFPLWTRMDGFGVISVYIGPGKVLFIENDRIVAGSSAYFANQPDLRIVGYGKQGGEAQ